MFIRKNISVYKRSDIIFCQQGLNVGKIRRYAAPWLSGGSTFSPKDLSMMFDEAKNLCCEVRIEPSVKNECSMYTSSYTIISIFASRSKSQCCCNIPGSSTTPVLWSCFFEVPKGLYEQMSVRSRTPNVKNISLFGSILYMQLFV